ncbi:MAG: dihydropyrimidinase [Anaerolineae bacterium]|nr:dihydropyrimidinase [Anaerolineae bacterium]MDW8102403.1 dihydropyrimidinase [Anaerolineae bacterium]
MDAVVKNGVIVTASETFEADIGIEGGKIAVIGKGLEAPLKIEAQGCYVFPGFIDVHVHLQMPVGDIVSADDFYTGTVAAACGGNTTIIDFAEARGSQSLLHAVEERRRQADEQVVIDYSLHLTGNRDDEEFLRNIAELAEQGYTSLKIYTTYPGLMVEDRQILRLLKVCRDAGILPIVHAENHHIIEQMKAQLLQEGKTSPRYHPVSRPCIAEAEAAQRVMALSAVMGTPVYFVHLSCVETLEAVRAVRRRGQEVYVEVTPHHLLLSDEEYLKPDLEGAMFVLSPPLRNKSHLEILWEALGMGEIQVVATDHCPWTREQKKRGLDNFTLIPNGAPGIETRIPLLFTFGVRRGKLSLNQFVDVCSTTPAKLFGLYPQKGAIVPGADADIVIFDPRKEVILSWQNLHQNVDHCPYEGWRVEGYPRLVLSRGEVIVEDGKFLGRKGRGLFLPRRKFQSRSRGKGIN